MSISNYGSSDLFNLVSILNTIPSISATFSTIPASVIDLVN
jgi:hypothetical protein